MQCKICQKDFGENQNEFSSHLRYDHKIKSEDYTLKYNYSGLRPHCKLCNSLTRYYAYTYKDYCKDHAKDAMSIAGRVGGSAPAWNKGADKTTDPRIAIQAKKVTGEGNHFFGRAHSEKTKEKIRNSKLLPKEELQKRLTDRSLEFKMLTLLEEYSDYSSYINFQCLKCNHIQQKTFRAFDRGSKCEKCFPTGSSQVEYEIAEYVKSLGVEITQSDRSVINPKEIDIYVPSKKLGIEYHGLYWHSEASPKDVVKDLHFKKHDLAAAKGVKLIQLFGDEWALKQDICKSMISSRLGIIKSNFGARECEVVKLECQQEKEFFDKSHISGSTRSQICLSLQKDKEVIAALSMRVPRQGKYKGYLEIARFSQALFTNCPGSLSRLLSVAKKYAIEKGYTGIMSYVDRRFGFGSGYESNGFKKIGVTGIDYWYTDCTERFDRFAFRATAGKSEREIAIERNVAKIYGAGSYIFSVKF